MTGKLGIFPDWLSPELLSILFFAGAVLWVILLASFPIFVLNSLLERKRNRKRSIVFLICGTVAAIPWIFMSMGIIERLAR